MAHKATLPHPAFVSAKPAQLSDAEKLLWRRFLIVLAVCAVVVLIVFFAPVTLSTAVAMGVFHGWDSPIDYD